MTRPPATRETLSTGQDERPPPDAPADVVGAVLDHVEHFQRRVIRQGLIDATADYWRRRAAAFEQARPKAGDFRGRATDDDLRQLDRRAREAAQACRARAEAAPLDSLDDLAEVMA